MHTLSLKHWLVPSDYQAYPIYLVGGTVRDLLMGTVPKDIDLVCRNAREVASGIARRKNAAFIPMEKKPDEPCYRVVDRDGPGNFLDIAEMRGRTILEDLDHRDFTINAIAMEISGERVPGDVIDPLNGLRDIKCKLIRMPNDRSFVSDPLRILRAFRFAASLGFEIESATGEELKKNIPLLVNVSAERIMSEVLSILRSPHSTSFFRQMDSAGILDVVFPRITAMKTCAQNGFHHLNVWEHSLLVMEHCEGLLNDLPRYFGERSSDVKENLERENRIPLLKLSAFLHDIGKPGTKGLNERNGRITFYGHDDEGARLVHEIAEGLKMPNRDSDFVVRLVAEHLHILHLASAGVKRSTTMKWFRGMGDDSVPALILSIADVMSILGPEATEEYRNRHITWAKESIIGYLARVRDEIGLPPLLTGSDLIALGMEPGPEMGRVLDLIRGARDSGMIRSREEALDLAKSLLSGKSLPPETD